MINNQNEAMSVFKSETEKLRKEITNINFKHSNQIKILEDQFELSTKEIVT